MSERRRRRVMLHARPRLSELEAIWRKTSPCWNTFGSAASTGFCYCATDPMDIPTTTAFSSTTLWASQTADPTSSLVG